jgi:polyhydroxybutyrate depolymerase
MNHSTPIPACALCSALQIVSAALLISFSLLLASCGGGHGGAGGTTVATADACGVTGPDPECHTLPFGGVTRAYLLHVPGNFQANTGALVIALHGSQGSGLRLSQTSGLSAKADQTGFAVAYPYALVSPSVGFTEWNEFFNGSFGDNPPDDAGFIRQLILTLQGSLHPDPKRIYVTGLSNGGFMAHRVAIQESDLVAAAAVVEGTVVSPGHIADVPAPLGPVSILIFHGDQDPTVLYCGQPVVASQEETFNYWSSANACTALDTTAALCDAQRNITAVFEKDATACAAGTEVKFYKLEGGVHQWYTVPMNVPSQVPFNPDFNSTTGVTTDDIMWNFFATHPKP